MYWAIAIAVILLSLASCTVYSEVIDSATTDKNAFRHSLRHLSLEERDHWRRIAEFIEIADPDLFKQIKLLSATTDSATIMTLVEAYYRRMDLEYNPETPDTNEWLGEMQKRIDYCDAHYTGPGVLGRHWDPRAVAAIKRGPPDYEYDYTATCRSVGGRSQLTCTIFVQEYADGTSLCYQGGISEAHPTDMIPCSPDCDLSSEEIFHYDAMVDREVKNIATPLFNSFPEGTRLVMAVQSFTRPNAKGAYDCYAIAGVDLSRLSIASDSARFHLDVIIYSAGKDPRKLARFTSPSVSLPRWAVKTDGAVFPLHLGYSLPAGHFTAVAALVQDSTPNVGAYSIDLWLPSPNTATGWSDLLLTSADDSGGATWNRIHIDTLPLKAYVNRVFRRGDTLVPFLEISLPVDTLDFTVLGVLHRIPTFKTIQPGYTGGTPIFSSVDHTINGRYVFRQPMVIPGDIRTGDYFLALLVEDAYQRRYGLAYTQIKIRK